MAAASTSSRPSSRRVYLRCVFVCKALSREQRGRCGRVLARGVAGSGRFCGCDALSCGDTGWSRQSKNLSSGQRNRHLKLVGSSCMQSMRIPCRRLMAVLLLLPVVLAADVASSCNDVESFAMRGTCDDGGPGAATSVCPLGSDPEDCGSRGGSVARRVGSLNPTPQTTEMISRLGPIEAAHRVSRREVDRRQGRRKLQQGCCSRLRLLLGGNEIAYVAGEKLHAGFPVYRRADAKPHLGTLFRWSGGSWSEWRLGARLDGGTAEFAGASYCECLPCDGDDEEIGWWVADSANDTGWSPMPETRLVCDDSAHVTTSPPPSPRPHRPRRCRRAHRPRHHHRRHAAGDGSIASSARHATRRATSAHRGSSASAATCTSGAASSQRPRRATPGSRRRRPTPPTDGPITTQR